MTQKEVVAKVNEVMSSGFELAVDQLTPAMRIKEDLGLDSLDAIDMLVYLEDELKVKVDMENFRSVKTLGDIYEMVEHVYKSSSEMQV